MDVTLCSWISSLTTNPTPLVVGTFGACVDFMHCLRHRRENSVNDPTIRCDRDRQRTDSLSTAMHCLERHPDLRVCIIEKDPHPASQQSGHNSGVIHSGIYYKPDRSRHSFVSKDAPR